MSAASGWWRSLRVWGLGASDTAADHASAESWQSVQRTVCLWLGPLGVLSCLIGLLAQRYTTLFFQTSLTLLALLLATLTLLLLVRVLNVGTVTRTAFVAYAAVMLLSLNRDFTYWVPQNQATSSVLYWIAILYTMAFVTFPARGAVLACRIIFAGVVGICAVRLGMLYGAGQLTGRIGASVAQYLIFNAVLVLAQFAVSRLRLQLDEARAVAYLDALTGLPNRRAAQCLLETLVSTAQPFCVVTFDIDHFKTVNDTHGHQVGDGVLCQIGPLVTAALLRPQILARWGGEEFVLVLPGLDMAQARALAEGVRLSLAGHDFAPAGRLTASFGVSEWVGGNDVEAVLRRADAALYAAKRGGRNSVQVAQVGATSP
ncbi:GGDEF domain-containing protein [Deinococcus sp.]|uniref:GGDEF domain-containing protein n=1 Tax=Deinococcus sp. TaxID=47478 RepID=UPI0025FFB975|nr:GGDEF domain-containing protein [Deinococcus sp.]